MCVDRKYHWDPSGILGIPVESRWDPIVNYLFIYFYIFSLWDFMLDRVGP
jgi:hypothetical protein